MAPQNSYMGNPVVRSLRRTAAVLVVAGCALAPAAQANIFDFRGAYNLGNWTLSNTNSLDLPAAVGGTVTSSFGTPTPAASGTVAVGLDVVSGNNQSGAFGTTSFTTTAISNAVVAFSWNFSTADSYASGNASRDPFGYILNGNKTYLYNSSAGRSGSGVDTNFTVSNGDTFGFFSETIDGFLGSSTASVYSFKYITEGQDPASVPGPLPILGVLAAAGWALRMRRKMQEAKA
jgi:hypothetical protein